MSLHTRIREPYVLPTIVFSQFACTSLWFAGNAIMPELSSTFSLNQDALYHLTSAVQLGFILGTLTFAFFSLADRYSPSKIFLITAFIGSFFNFIPTFGNHSFLSLFVTRLATGFCLAGIYPIGMKIAADYHKKGLGKALGFLVGALVLGTAFPHFIRSLTSDLPWKAVLISTSVIAIVGGLLIGVGVPDGPYRKASTSFDPKALLKIFRNKPFRNAAFGYFGHMWELYTFWTFVPLILVKYESTQNLDLNQSILTFLVIALGCFSCILGGYISLARGSKGPALVALMISGICCLISPFMYQFPVHLFLAFLILWGLAVIADSPQFSSLVAKYASSETRGTALTVVNCIGFGITIVSIQTTNYLFNYIAFNYLLLVLAAGPAIGVTFGILIPGQNKSH